MPVAAGALVLAITVGLAAPAPDAARALAERRFTLTFAATIPAVRGSGPVRVWLPVPQVGPDQDVEELLTTAPVPTRITREPIYGTRMLYAQLGDTGPATVAWTARVTRREHLAGRAALGSSQTAQIERLLADDARAVVHHPQVELALAKAAGGRRLMPDEIPRAIYDHVVSRMQYDKTAPGWGQGDTLRACAVGKGNCTDFHSLFTSMARAAGIPAEFAIGLTIPDSRAGEISGYHCWAQFLSGQRTWVPVDASEACKHPERREYYFGNLGADRVELSRGRDIILEPRQSGAPLNYFVAPYAEQSGHPLATSRKVTFEEVPHR